MCLFPVYDDDRVTGISDRDVVGTIGRLQGSLQLGGAEWRQELLVLLVEPYEQGLWFDVGTPTLEFDSQLVSTPPRIKVLRHRC